MERQETLCVKCGNACTSGCCWAEELKPVPGWNATAFYDKHRRRDLYSYCVNKCPQYVPDKPLKVSDLDNDGCMNLLMAELRDLKDEYLHDPRQRSYLTRWINSPMFKRLFMGVSPDVVLKGLRAAAKRFDNIRIARVP